MKYANGKTDSSFTINEDVTTIYYYAFYNAKNITNLIFGDEVLTVNSDAFQGCTNLKNVYYEGEVEDWCKISFTNANSNPLQSNSNLYFNNVLVEDLIIPSTVTTVKQYAFTGYKKLTNIYLPKELRSIGNEAFNSVEAETVLYSGSLSDWMKVSINYNVFNGAYLYCNNELINEIVIPEGTTSINQYQFAGFESIISVTMPSSVTTIGQRAFKDCKNLQTIAFSDKLKTVGYYSFDSCTSLTEIILPETVTMVDQGAFIDCKNLRTIVIPASVTKLGQNCFGYVHSQLVCTVYATTPISNNYYMFGVTQTPNIKVYVPAESVDAYKTAQGWSQYKNQIFAME